MQSINNVSEALVGAGGVLRGVLLLRERLVGEGP